jgi:hypothetical protein
LDNETALKKHLPPPERLKQSIESVGPKEPPLPIVGCPEVPDPAVLGSVVFV